MKIAFDAFILTLCLVAVALAFIKGDVWGVGFNLISAAIWFAYLRHDMKEAKR